jgi:UDP-N-acetylglucosamine 2-epimerase (non-hydrolysing)
MPIKVLHVVGARPNFMKTAPIMAEMARYPDLFHQTLVHTGQHYDYNMSRVFFDDLDMPDPDEFLDVGSGTHAEQTARIMLAFEPVLMKYLPDWVFVVGDVNSTLACALVCAKLGAKLAHVEAGLRSGDRTMPEEINRILTDQIADFLFTPSRDADANLLREGVSPEKIAFIGNVMIDTLVRMLPKARQRPIIAELNLEPQGYVLVTLHRPSNVDEPATLEEIARALIQIARRLPIVFPVHPRTHQRLASLDIDWPKFHIRLIAPLGYLDFLALENSARLVLTDSGGVQEETTYLGVPCLTVRSNTERPVTIEVGTNRLVANSCDAMVSATQQELKTDYRVHRHIELWDGAAAERIRLVLMGY